MSGISTTRERMSRYQTGQRTSAKTMMETTMTTSRNEVPQRRCRVRYFLQACGVSSSPCSSAWIAMCSAPWYSNTRRRSGMRVTRAK